jgi:hypothetical protein
MGARSTRGVLAQLVVLAPEENNSNCVDCGGTIDDEQATYRSKASLAPTRES